MIETINIYITGLNYIGQVFWDYAAVVFIQVSLLIVLLLMLDFLLRKQVRAVFRYCLWMLLFIKLILPASFTLPTGIGYWLGDYFPSEVSTTKPIPEIEEPVPVVQMEDTLPMVIDIPQRYVLEMPTMNETTPVRVELDSISWQGLVFSGWMLGMFILSVLVVKRFRFVKRLIADSRPANERSLEMLDECRSRMGIRQSVELRLISSKLSPAVCGFFKPVILMPATLLQKLSREKLKTILIHELAHVKRGDAWVNLLQTIMQIVYFYNPLVWLANMMIRRAREQAVDEMVLVTLSPETKNYSNMLIDIAEMAFWRPNFSLRIIGVVESKKALERRITHMLTRPAPKSSKLGSFGLIAIVAIGSILLPMGRNSTVEAAGIQENPQAHSETNIIIPGERVGDCTLGMSKDEVLKHLGKPESIFYGDNKYTLNNLPKTYYMFFGDISFEIDNDFVKSIGVHSPFYKFTNGLGVGDSEKAIKKAFGYDFHLGEGKVKDYLSYKGKGLHFEISRKDRTIKEIGIRRKTEEKDAKDIQHTIVPGQRIGDYALNMSKDDVLKKLGDPESIQLGGKKYSLNNLPSRYIMAFGDVSFWIENDSVEGISVHSPRYKLSNGLGVGDSEQKIKQAFGEDFQPRTEEGKDFQCYDAEGFAFEINKNNQTVSEIVIYGSDRGENDASTQQEYSKDAIVPGRRIGAYTLDMSKDDVLKKLGEPDTVQLGEDEIVRRGQEKYSLDNLPDECILSFGNISFWFEDDSVGAISVCSPLYKLSNGLKVGDSEQKIKQAFGEDFQLEEDHGKDFRCYHAKGLGFEINKNNQTISEIVIYKSNGERDESAQQEYSKDTIVPGRRIGAYTLDMSKDDVLKKLGEPDTIQLGDEEVNVVHRGQEKYNLDNLPDEYILSFDNISFWFGNDSLEVISVRNPLYKLSNGLKVGDSERRIKQAFGEDFNIEGALGRTFLCKHSKGIGFEINKNNQTIAEIVVYHPQGHRGDQEDKQDRNVEGSHDSRAVQRETPKVIMLSDQPPGPITFPKIDRHPAGGDFGRGTLESLPHYNLNSTENWQVDLRGRDVSRLDLRKSIDDLFYADFDNRTTWPTADRMPEGFDKERIMKLGKNPGLGVREVHKRGITGQGIGIAIVDQPLLTKHQEYADRLRLYEENNIKPESDAAMHGAAVASIALGKTVGVAPEADLYYIGSWTGDWGKGEGGFEWNFVYYAQAVRRILEINKQLPDDRKIRVISISVGWSPKQKGYDEMTAAVEEAKKAGMLVVCSCIDDVHGFVFDGLGRKPLSDPEDYASYEPGLWLAKGFYRGQRKWNQLWVPMDSRTTAAPNGADEYVFYRQGGWSWAIPYVAGVYALAAQADSEITPERFWKLAMKSGRTVEVEHQGRKYELGPVVDPGALIDALEDK